MLDRAELERRLPELARAFQHAEPFPWAALDGFVDLATARQLAAAFPASDAPDAWMHYAHVNERKLAASRRESLPGIVGELVDELNGAWFVGYLERLTGIRGLQPDPDLAGGGMHAVPRGGFLNVHADFTAHPHRSSWARRVNVLVYLNEAWQPEWGGALELWDRAAGRCVQRILPEIGRCVVFATDATSFHGHPDPLSCPPGVARKSIALYFFTDEARPVARRSTNYRPRPQDGPLQAALIAADRQAVRVYDRVRWLLGMSDGGAAGLLRRLSRLGRRS